MKLTTVRSKKKTDHFYFGYFWMILGGITVNLLGLSTTPALAAKETRQPAAIEKKILDLSLKLKPIPNETWATIAGSKASEEYQIVKGDTLYDISKRLFGDPNYWPKIWSLNNAAITNPHWIAPGVKIAFLAGSGNQLPSVAVSTTSIQNTSDTENTSTTENKVVASNKKSDEWKDLPLQKWEEIHVVPPEELERVGLEKDLKEKLLVQDRHVKINLVAMASTKKIEPLGRIESSTSEAYYFTVGDKVFISYHKTPLQIGQTYALTTEPGILISPRKNLRGFSYHIMGSVVIQDEQNGLYIGKITETSHLVTRNCVLIPSPPKIADLEFTQGPDPMEAGIIIDPEFPAPMGVQFQQVFLDRGTVDGMTPGLTFGLYQDDDPYTNLPVGKKNVHKFAEIVVVQVSENFSSALIKKSERPIYSKMIAKLISDPGALAKEIQSYTPQSISKTAGDLIAPSESPSPTPSDSPNPEPSPENQSPVPSVSPSPETAQ